MKKILLGTALLGAVCFVNAQVVTTQSSTQVKVYRLGSTTTNQAYTAPDYIVYDFTNTYPQAATIVVWEPVDVMWRGSYIENNRISHVYYNTNGVNYKVSLPVINTYVPEDVIASAINMYGTALYSISSLKPIGDTYIYQVRLLDNTLTKDTWMDAKGVVMTDDEVYKIKLENDKLKIKSDEEKMKMKMEQQ